MTESTERQPYPDSAEPTESYTAEVLADIYPLPNELRIVPASVAIDKAIAVAAARFEEVSELDVLTPEQGGEALSAHRLCLMLLENSSIDHALIAAELGYRSEGAVMRAIGLARKETADRLKTRFEISQIRYKRELDAWLEEQRLRKEQRLFELARADDADAWGALQKQYEPYIFKAVYRLGDDVPYEAIEVAYRIFDEQVRDAEPDTLLSFDKTLASALGDGLATYVEHKLTVAALEEKQRQTAEELRNLDVKTFRRELKKYEASLDNCAAESSLDQATVRQVVSGALEYFSKRLSGELPPPVKHYDPAHPKAKQISINIRDTFKRTVRSRLHVSALMQERGVKGFNLTSLTDEQFQIFLAATLDEAADTAMPQSRVKKKR